MPQTVCPATVRDAIQKLAAKRQELRTREAAYDDIRPIKKQRGATGDVSTAVPSAHLDLCHAGDVQQSLDHNMHCGNDCYPDDWYGEGDGVFFGSLRTIS